MKCKVLSKGKLNRKADESDMLQEAVCGKFSRVICNNEEIFKINNGI